MDFFLYFLLLTFYNCNCNTYHYSQCTKTNNVLCFIRSTIRSLCQVYKDKRAELRGIADRRAALSVCEQELLFMANYGSLTHWQI